MQYDFDRVIERRGTDSAKWARYREDVLPLPVADMDFASPQPVIEALRRRVEHGVFGYGFEAPRLRPVLQARLERLYGWHVAPEDFLLLPGVVVGFHLVSRAVAEPGDEVLVHSPAYPHFFDIAKNTGRTVGVAPLIQHESGCEIDFDAFERAITPRTRMFLLCNPHNPTGRVFTRAELERMAEICLRHDLFICSDEIHQDFVYPGHSHIPIATLAPEVAARTITLFSPSKSYNIAGFHFAIAVATDPEVQARLAATMGGLLSGRPGVLDFVAGLTAYEEGGEWLTQVLEYLRGNRDFLVRYVSENLEGITVAKPEGTYLAWLDCRQAGIEGAPDEFFLREAKVALSEGVRFGAGCEGFVRVNFGCPRSLLEEALGRMQRALGHAGR